MSTSAPTPAPPASGGDTRPPRLRWWKEVLYVAAFYLVYSLVRNTFGSAAVEPVDAFRNAERVIGWQRAIGLYHEETIQGWFLGWTWFIAFWNYFYGTFHFVVTAGALVWLFRRHPARYRFWRTALAATTGLAIIGYATFPLMPPRLLPEFCTDHPGACREDYDYVDTLADDRYPALWSFDDERMEQLSNQYAAMPSMHFGWSAWCALALLGVTRRRRNRGLLAAYPWVTLFAIVVTANHFWLDAAGGALALAAGAGVAWLWVRRLAPAAPGGEGVDGPDREPVQKIE